MLRFNKLAVLAMLVSTLTLTVKAEEIFAITTDNKLIRFDSSTPGDIVASVTVTGLQTGETILGIDIRPIDGKIYALGSSSRIYTIDAASGAATQSGTGQLATLLSGTKFGFDVNPASGGGTGSLLRVVSDTAQNLRVNVNGTIDAVQTTPAYVTNGLTGTPQLTGAAYTNNTVAPGGTQLFVLDSSKDALFAQEQTTTHGLTLVGFLGVDSADTVGFEISGQTGVAYAALTKTGATVSTLYTINLLTGSATEIGDIGSTTALVGITAPTAPLQIAYGINPATEDLRKFLLNSPGTAIGNDVAITGGASTGIVGIDFRPATGQLYALTSNGSAFGLYSIDITTGVSTQAGSNFVLPNTPAGTFYDIDFNPTVDRIRFVASSGTNARLHPDTGAVVAIDGTLAFAAGDVSTGSPAVVAAAYINNFGGATSTTLYDLDNANDVLTTQIPPNSGTLNTVGGLKPNGSTSNTNAGSDAAFDIGPDGRAFATLGGSTLFQINLSTGAIISVGGITGSITEFAIPTNGSGAVGSPGSIAFSASSYQVVEGQLGTITLNRSGGTSGLVSVFLTTLTTNANTATSGVDYTALGQTVSFADGEATRTVPVEGLTDSTLELFETATLVLSNPVGASLGTLSTSTLIVVDVDDRDGDGFTTAEELAAGTSDTDASSTPFGGAPAGAADTTNMTVTKVAVKLNFTKANSDAISFGGTFGGFTVTDLSTLSGQKVTINFGGVTKSLTLGAKGKAASTDKKDSFTISKPKSNVSKFSVKFNKGDFDTALTDEGLGDDPDSPSKAPRTVVVRVLFNGKAYVESLALEAKISSGKGSAAKNAKLPR